MNTIHRRGFAAPTHTRDLGLEREAAEIETLVKHNPDGLPEAVAFRLLGHMLRVSGNVATEETRALSRSIIKAGDLGVTVPTSHEARLAFIGEA